jgi:alanine racemase
MMRSTRLEVDLDSITHNFREAKRMLAQGPCASDGRPPLLAAVLKANAYGMGALAVAEELLASGAELFAVACLPEAVELRRRLRRRLKNARPEARILIMGHTPSEYFPIALEHRATLTIFDLEQAKALSSAARDAGSEAVAHIKVDTGMNRLGLKPGSGSAGMIAAMAELPALRLEGIFTHLALDSNESDRRQFELFTSLIEAVEARGLTFELKHVCDSISLMRYPEYRLDMVRAGALLFGVKPMNTPLSESADIRTPFALKTRISRLRRIEPGEGVGYDSTFRAPPGGALLATLPIGYADGYPRRLSNRAQVLVRGRRAPVVGLICMDQLTVDASAIPGAAEGDEALLLGPGIDVSEVSDWAQTNRNEIISSISRRVPRVYYKDMRPVFEVDYLGDTQGGEGL